MNRSRCLRATILACLMLSSAACAEKGDETAAPESRDRGTEACAARYVYEGRDYKGIANRQFTATSKLGYATQPPCNDTGKGTEFRDLEKKNAYRVSGISPTVAIAVGENAKTAKLFAVYSGSQIPEEIKELGKNS
ncbi:DUF6281 family protein [Streptomyces indiaensis]|uniref:Lipoprotein n=1 Tax=Streptomyces indiaensis TaxID=284033 RepID=A0ABP5Q7R4_9ACTN|nr:DUF6281 family protein [Streptomyces indiaensis]MCF1648073.1 DUF6281 family protein [Streptomyces indiaensis]